MRKTCLFLLVLSSFCGSVTADEASPDLVARGEKLVREKPSFLRQVGLSELYRAVGRNREALTALQTAETKNPEESRLLREWICWRLLPLTGSNREVLGREVERLRQAAPSSPWLHVHDMILASQLGDRAALLRMSQQHFKPPRFPTELAEAAHRALLEELGTTRNRAGLEVLAARTYEPLHGLRDLDLRLSREAAFFQSAGHPEDARLLFRARDALRQAYDHGSRTVIEKLFAMNLLRQHAKRDALLQQARSYPYLTNRQALTALLDRTDEESAWNLLIQPLLRSELDYLQSPPRAQELHSPRVLDAQVIAGRRTEAEGIVLYERDVSLSLESVMIRCDRLVVVHQAKAGSALNGNGKVSVVGLPGLGEVEADRFILSADTGGFTFGGHVRLHSGDRVQKLNACTITRTGEVRDARSFLDDFAKAPDTPAKLKLLPDITQTYADEELPEEGRYLLALQLLRPQLTWHAPFLPLPSDPHKRELEEIAKEQRELEVGPWREAMTGEPWMQEDIPEELRELLTQRIETFNRGPDGKAARLKFSDAEAFFWRLQSADHPDVIRALKLLDEVQGTLNPRAQRWAAEVRRNNTVLTFDVSGGYAAGKPAPVVLDVRNADRVGLRLYRIRKPADLLAVLDRVGTDFVYRDHGLQHEAHLQHQLEPIAKMQARQETGPSRQKQPQAAVPNFDWADLVQEWQVNPTELKAVPRKWLEFEEYQEYQRDDGDYFEDACLEFEPRIEKYYRPQRWGLSSWQCDRIVEVPGKAVSEAGAYVLVAEANGQRAVVPLIVDPLSLTLRRCRDGVLALVSDADGARPVAGAEVLASQQREAAVSDTSGVAFAHVFAAGDRAIVVHKDGRYAVGGFGRVFEGIYQSPWQHLHRLQEERELERRLVAKEHMAHLFSGNHVLAAYTDRPTYRPGQPVHFKLIARHLKQEPNPGDTLPGFRANDFDRATRLELLPPNTRLQYAVVDPRGRDITAGSLELNEFGTAADTLTLSAEAAVGAYSLRVRLAEMDRIVPDTFSVRYYHRPNFELQASGVPAKVKNPESFTVKLQGQYYFGKPVVGGRVEVKLVRHDPVRPLAEAEGVLNAEGLASVELEPPARLRGGKYAVVCTLSDNSDRTVTKTLPLEIEGEHPRGGLTQVPQFVRVDSAFSLAANAEVTS